MKREIFLTTLAGFALSLRSKALADIPPIVPDIELPGVFLRGRPFLRPTTADGTRVLAWLDTDGSGFITEALVRKLGLAVSGKRAAVPLWREQVPAVGGDGLLPILPATSDPILAGIDIQFGGSWFAHRVWTIDYRNQKIVWHSSGGAAASDAVNPVPLRFTDESKQYPMIPVVISGDVIPMTLDTAASVVPKPGDIAATSFVTRAQFAKWHAAHPEWNVKSVSMGVDAIDVPDVRVAGVPLGGVTFTTRPNDDVFEGESVAGKLGSNAFVARELIIDYTRATAGID
jgi:hypothetical protein